MKAGTHQRAGLLFCLFVSVSVFPSTHVPRLTGDGTLYSDGIVVVAKCLHVRVVISSSQLSLVSKVFF